MDVDISSFPGQEGRQPTQILTIRMAPTSSQSIKVSLPAGYTISSSSRITLTITSLDVDYQSPRLVRTLTYNSSGRLTNADAQFIGTVTVNGAYQATVSGQNSISKKLSVFNPLTIHATELPRGLSAKVCILLPPVMLPTPWGVPIPIPNTLDLDLVLDVGLVVSGSATISGGFTASGAVGAQVSWTPPAVPSVSRISTLTATSTPITVSGGADVETAAVLVDALWDIAWTNSGLVASAGPVLARQFTLSSTPPQLDVTCDLGLRFLGGVRLNALGLGFTGVLGPFDWYFLNLCKQTIP
ncbi:MAG: hypothetical protein U0841_35330 [Chloroflexia bacterium]